MQVRSLGRIAFRLGWLILLPLPLLAQSDREALIALYQSANGDGWVNNAGWKQEPQLGDGFNDDPCSQPSWYGISCREGRVRAVRLNKNGLTGTLPRELTELSELRRLDLSRNKLFGPIPVRLGELSPLTSLNLSINRLSGAIPATLGELTQLRELDLGFNRLRGTIPAELGRLSQLTYLELVGNPLGGAIPAELSRLSQLTDLNLGDCELSGLIPGELGQLSQLRSLNLAFNRLSGVIPAELGNLSELQSLTLPDNQLSGPIPAELGKLSRLITLLLASNQLSGAIPAELGRLSELRILGLQFNLLSGAIPAELGDLSQLTSLDLSFNHLSGPIPAELGDLSQLRTLLLASNQLSGAIPSELGKLPVTRLDLQQNRLSGIVPAEIAKLPKGVLDLRDNRLESVEKGFFDRLDRAQRGEARWDSLQSLVAVYPQLSMGGGVEAVLMISNPRGTSNLPWGGRAYLDGGRWPPKWPWRLDGRDRKGESSFAVFIDASATRKLVLSSGSEDPVEGWLSLRSEGDSRPHGIASALFFNRSGESGLADSAAAVPGEFSSAFRIPVEQSESVSMRIAIRCVAARVRIVLIGAGGKLVRGTDIDEDQASLLNELFEDLPAEFIGRLEIHSRSPFFAAAIRIERSRAGGEQLTIVPATPVGRSRR